MDYKAWIKKAIKGRTWPGLRTSWLDDVPDFSSIEDSPSPTVEDILKLANAPLPKEREHHADVQGLRAAALLESAALFHRTCHVLLAAERLARSGMTTWSMFNSYHASYLAARGTMTLLGVVTPRVRDVQVLVDLFPPELGAKKDLRGLRPDDRFAIIRVERYQHQEHWETFGRLLQVSKVDCWPVEEYGALRVLPFRTISRQRNRQLYGMHWPLPDLLMDAEPIGATQLADTTIGSEDDLFFIKLSFAIFRLFEALIVDLGNDSGAVLEMLEKSRCRASGYSDEFEGLRHFSLA